MSDIELVEGPLLPAAGRAGDNVTESSHSNTAWAPGDAVVIPEVASGPIKALQRRTMYHASRRIAGGRKWAFALWLIYGAWAYALSSRGTLLPAVGLGKTTL